MFKLKASVPILNAQHCKHVASVNSFNSFIAKCQYSSQQSQRFNNDKAPTKQQGTKAISANTSANSGNGFTNNNNERFSRNKLQKNVKNSLDNKPRSTSAAAAAKAQLTHQFIDHKSVFPIQPRLLIPKNTPFLSDQMEGRIDQAKIERGFFSCTIFTSLHPAYRGLSIAQASSAPFKKLAELNESITQLRKRLNIDSTVPLAESNPRRRRPWDIACVIYGFKSKLQAMEFEYFLNQPYKRQIQHLDFGKSQWEGLEGVSMENFQEHVLNTIFQRAFEAATAGKNKKRSSSEKDETGDEEKVEQVEEISDMQFEKDASPENIKASKGRKQTKAKSETKADDMDQEEEEIGENNVDKSPLATPENEIQLTDLNSNLAVRLSVLFEMFASPKSPFHYTSNGIHIKFFKERYLNIAQRFNPQAVQTVKQYSKIFGEVTKTGPKTTSKQQQQEKAVTPTITGPKIQLYVKPLPDAIQSMFSSQIDKNSDQGKEQMKVMGQTMAAAANFQQTQQAASAAKKSEMFNKARRIDFYVKK